MGNQKSGVRLNPIPKYAPVGSCIYCNGEFAQPGEPLSDEHIIPLALGGNLILPKSSCAYCARVTNEVETKVLRGGLFPSKELLNLPSRSKAGERPENFKLHCINGDEGRSISIPKSDYPAILLLPKFPGPGLAEFSNRSTVQEPPWYQVISGELATLHSKYGIETFATPSISAGPFGRMLAKMGHAFASAELGRDKFVGFLPDHVLNDTGNVLTFLIGNIQLPSQHTAKDQIHQLQIVTETVGETTFLCCHIRLFSNLNAPIYRVVVGQANADFDPERRFQATIFDERSAGDFRLEVDCRL